MERYFQFEWMRACSVLKSCLTLWDPVDCSPSSSSVHGILQARILEWVAIFSSRGSSWPKDRTRVLYVSIHRDSVYVCVLVLSCVWLFAIPWTVGWQAPLFIGFFRQEYWSRLPFPSPGDLPNTGIEPESPALQADSLLSEAPGKSHRGSR